ncbi:PoNe immunity protein domain-containing protein [Ramlibacter rhizophilus]|uniref:DUF1911 domain-containing protein n=1 Tax=Ramlibacter rhizophilus TaxID=1781167 RepID=A0A4Z0BGC8_9BURK|nr:PoNe immunity protein domain-containing protein [Ramlibacter rhizophilus]TFY97337.1 DUF1911 domain-containing protein [Ramlibacter rhizophilus]
MTVGRIGLAVIAVMVGGLLGDVRAAADAPSVSTGAIRSQGQADGQEQAHANTQVSAGNALVVRSGGDTTLRGAVIDAHSVTRAGITGIAGDTAARTGDAQTGIAPIFDAERVQREIDAQVTITQHALPQLFRAAGTYADRQRDDLRTRARGEVDPQRQAELNAQAGRWEEGGDIRVALHSAIGLVGGDVAGAVGSGAAAAAAPALEQLQNGVSVALADVGLAPALAREVASGVASVAAAGIGGIASGGALAGAATGMNVDANNRQLHAAEERWLKDKAKDFARQEGISEDEALRRLTQQALKDVDFLWRAQLADGDDAKAQAFLAGAQQTFTNDLGAQQRLFTASGQQLLRPEMFAETADPAFYRQFAQSGISRSLSAGLAKELRDSGIDVARGAVDLARTVRDNPALVVNAVWETVRSLPQSVVDGFKESGTSIGEGSAVALSPDLAGKVNALYGTDAAGAQRALLAIRVAAAVTGTAGAVKATAGAVDATAGAVKASGAAAEEAAAALARKLDAALEEKAVKALLMSGGVHDRSGNPLLDLKQLTDAQKGAMGDLFGASTVKQIVPDGQKIARTPGVGQTGIDDLYKVNRPDVDYVVIEYKFVGDPKRSGSSSLSMTADGRQGSEQWITGSERLIRAVGDQAAEAVEMALRNGRTEAWVVTTRADGSINRFVQLAPSSEEAYRSNPMIRAPLGDLKYWNDRVRFDRETIESKQLALKEPSKNPLYDPEFAMSVASRVRRLMLRRYSRGDSISDLKQHFPALISSWELSNSLSDEVCKKYNRTNCRDWIFELRDLNHYNWCFWLVGLALALEIPNDQWQRLLALIGGEGEDVLLDQVIAFRQPGRLVGTKLLHPKPYARLLRTIGAPREQQPQLLLDFVDHWYPELARKGKDELWWYIYGDPVKHPLEMGSYFGRWCIEAVAAVKAFGIDDSLCLGHEHYPGDLLRPDGPTTHRPRQEQGRPGLVGKLFQLFARR